MMWRHWHSVVVFIVRCYWLLVITVQTVVLCFVDWHHCFTSESNKELNYFKHNVWSRQVRHIRLSTGMWILAAVNSSLHWYKLRYSLTSHSTHRLFRRRFLWVTRPNQQCHSTEGRVQGKAWHWVSTLIDNRSLFHSISVTQQSSLLRLCCSRQLTRYNFADNTWFLTSMQTLPYYWHWLILSILLFVIFICQPSSKELSICTWNEDCRRSSKCRGGGRVQKLVVPIPLPSPPPSSPLPSPLPCP